MIISGGARSYWRDFAPHLMKTEDNQRVRIAEIRGFAADNVTDAFREMEAIASGTQAKRFYYHANLNPRAEERLTEEQWDKAIDTLEQALGLEGQSRVVVEHEKFGRTHRHVIWSRIDVDTMTAIPDKWNYYVHQRTADALEKEFDHEPTPRDRGPEGPNPDNREVYRGKLSGVDARDVKADLTALWRQADSGPAFAAALAEQGYILAKGDRRDFVVVDTGGNEHSLSRRVGAKAAEVRTRMATVDREELPTVSEAMALARERADKREDRDQPAVPDPSAPAGSPKKDHSTFELLAEELLEAAHSALSAPEPKTPESPRPEGGGNLVQEAAQAASEAAPVLAEITAAAAALESHDAPAELSAFDRFASEMKQALREGGGEPSAAEGWRWLAERSVPAPARPEEPTAFGRFIAKMKDAMRSRGGEPETGDGRSSFWQRSADLFSAAIEQAGSWAKQLYEGFAARFASRGQGERDDPGLER